MFKRLRFVTIAKNGGFGLLFARIISYNSVWVLEQICRVLSTFQRHNCVLRFFGVYARQKMYKFGKEIQIFFGKH